MAIDIPFKASVDVGDGAKSLRTLKQEFKDAQEELDGLVIGSEEYINSLKKLEGVRGDIDDLNRSINAFAPEAKVQAFGGVVSGLASGFQAATGAAALLGIESEDLQKTLLRVQAVMAFTEGIKGVIMMGDAFKVLNVIIAANPIGALVTALALATAGIIAFVKSTDDEAEAQKRANEELKKANELLEQQIKHLRGLQNVRRRADQFQLDLLKARGASEQELYDKEKELINKRLADLDYLRGYRGTLNVEESKEYTDLVYRKILLDEQYHTTIREREEETTKKKREEYNKRIEDEREARKKLEADLAAEIKEQQAEDEKREQEKKEKDEKNRADRAKAELERIAEDQKRLDEKRERDKAIEEQELKDRVSIAQAYNTSLIGLSDTVFAIKSANLKKGSKEEEESAKKQFKINKALSISSAIISGLQGVVNALSAKSIVPDPIGSALKIANAISVGAATAANVAKIAATQFNATGGGGVGSLPTASSASAPTINPPSNSTTELNPDGTVKTKQEIPQPVVKAVVVETDVTSSQKRVRQLEQQSKIQ